MPRALRFIVLFGFISLLSDVTYEGARGVAGPFLGALGAGSLAIGFASGLGEFAAYALRFLTGAWADRTGAYWSFTLCGYAVNLCAVPLLAFAPSWEAAVVLYIAERVGKAIRAPARDAMLSHATSQVGHGWGFGLHEAMDQIGAVAGPLLVAWVLNRKGEYQAAFLALLIPAAAALLLLLVTRFLYHRPEHLAASRPRPQASGLPKRFYWHLGGAALVAFGYVDYPLIAFHFDRNRLVEPAMIPVYYSLAMACDALSALVFGRLYDRFGSGVLPAATLLGAAFVPVVFLYPAPAWAAAAWGAGLGVQESILRAAVAAWVPGERRGAAFGFFHGIYGLAWFAGSTVLAALYRFKPEALAGVSLISQCAAAIIFYGCARALTRPRPTH